MAEGTTTLLELSLRLYVAGDSPNSTAAISNLKKTLGQQHYRLETIDVLSDPDRALDDGVFVTPCLVRVAPLPERRVVGSLTLCAAVLMLVGTSS